MAKHMNNMDLIEHLRKHSIKEILENCIEKNNHTALRFMCILDFYMVERNLYERIHKSGQPKLLQQLLGFRHFETFKFYDYRFNIEIRKYTIQCKYCELIGPYLCILSHMAINDDVDTSSKTCFFCNREELAKHIEDKTLEKCYKSYIQQRHIQSDEKVCKIVADFFDMLRKISDKLSISTIRNQNYAARGYTSVQRLEKDYGNDFPKECIVSVTRSRKNRSIQSIALNVEFERVMDILYGKNIRPRVKRRRTMAIDDVIVIESDDDEYHDEGSEESSSDQTERRYPAERNFATYEMPVPGEVTIENESVKEERRSSVESTQNVTTSAIPMDRPSMSYDRRLSYPSTSSASTSFFNNRTQNYQENLNAAQPDDTNESPMSLNLMKRETSASIQSTPVRRPSAIPTSSQGNTSRLGAMPTVNRLPSGDHHHVIASTSSPVPEISVESRAEKFGNNVARRLIMLPDDSKRQKLEDIIRVAIWKFEEESLE